MKNFRNIHDSEITNLNMDTNTFTPIPLEDLDENTQKVIKDLLVVLPQNDESKNN